MKKFFTVPEFRGFYDRMDPELLEVMEKFRAAWGKTVLISPAPGAIGRKDGNSFHNYVLHGKIKAIDLMPQGLEKANFKAAFEAAVNAGATGIGIYPDWKPQPGIHIDVGVRPGRGVGNPARWSGVNVDGKQVYKKLEEVL